MMIVNKVIDKQKQNGAVSIFIVIFAVLLIAIVTVSFVRIMIQNQQQSNATDLSQSAYDSALVGVEDAKRALLKYKQCIINGGGNNCISETNINSTECNEAVNKLEDVNESINNEVEVKDNDSDTESNALNQAYTCVKINTITPNYLNKLNKDSGKLIPLVSKPGSEIKRITIKWFNNEDLGSLNLNISNDGGKYPLLRENDWTTISSVRPSIMRAQFIGFNKSGFNLLNFDGNDSNVATSETLFLYPSSVSSSVANYAFSVDGRKKSKNILKNAHCNKDINSSGGYACSAKIELPMTVDDDHKAFLYLKSIYKGSNYLVELEDEEGNSLNFYEVQPSIDSTGRAGDLFRRVEARVEMFGDITHTTPDAIYTKGNFCKDFMVTDSIYIPGSCEP